MKHLISTIFNGEVITCERISEILKVHDEILLELLTVGFSDSVPRAECYNLTIQDVEDVGDGQFNMYYQFDYSVHNGCADMRVEGEREESAVVTLENGKIYLEVPELPSYQNRQFD